MTEVAVTSEELLENDRRVKRLTGHTPAYWKRHSPPQHTHGYNRAFSRHIMRLFITDQAKCRKAMEANRGGDLTVENPRQETR